MLSWIFLLVHLQLIRGSALTVQVEHVLKYVGLTETCYLSSVAKDQEMNCNVNTYGMDKLTLSLLGLHEGVSTLAMCNVCNMYKGYNCLSISISIAEFFSILS